MSRSHSQWSGSQSAMFPYTGVGCQRPNVGDRSRNREAILGPPAAELKTATFAASAGVVVGRTSSVTMAINC
jgi:hypothetical protein